MPSYTPDPSELLHTDADEDADRARSGLASPRWSAELQRLYYAHRDGTCPGCRECENDRKEP